MKSQTRIMSAVVAVLALSMLCIVAGPVDATDSKFSVSYEVDEMTYMIQVEGGSTCTLVPADDLGGLPLGMSFAGWETADGTVLAAGSVITVTADTHLTAQLVPTIYSATFIAIEGEPGIGFGSTYGAVVDQPEDPVREGWIFRGWSDGERTYPGHVPALTESVTYTAVWSKDHAMTFAVDDLVVLTTCVSEGIAPQDPSRTGYEFLGWAVGGKIVDPLTVVLTEDSTFNAVWRAAVYTVEFYVGGILKATQTVLHGGQAMEPAVRMSANYDGWAWDFSKPITGDTVIIAQKAQVDNTMAYIVIAVGALLTLVIYGLYRAVRKGTITVNRKGGKE